MEGRMSQKRSGKVLLLFCLLGILLPSVALAQRTGYSREEMMRRRKALMAQCREGLIILFGDTVAPANAHFRQDNDFFYFTGVEDLNAVCVLTPKTGGSYLFLPQQSAREKMVSGLNLLEKPGSKEKTGFTDILPLSYFDEFIARNIQRNGLVFHLRLSPRDDAGDDRWETLIFVARKNRSHYNDQITLDIKSAEEIEIMRHNGRISAEAVKQAMLAGRPGAFEYEAEAAAMAVVLKGGAKYAAYPPIVGSGPNTCIWHYEDNSRKIEDGDLVLMDYGADLDQLCMDITRTWPANGRFTPEQREVYEIVLEIEKACIEAYRPGVTSEDVEKHVAEIMKKKGLDPRGETGGIGHYVGLATHDCGLYGVPLREGMVFAIEPALYYPEKNIGIRVEDTVLITKNGCEVLTGDVPKEINEIEKLLQRKR
jgi:Xaa-Pro aminopeptidase